MVEAAAQRVVPAQDERIIFGSLALYPSGYTVSVDGRDVAVTVPEFLLLVTLMRHPYRVLDRETLARALDEKRGRMAPTAASLRAVDLHISRLRKKLRAAGCDPIATMRFVGYRFVPRE
jgi:DNA-binding response OmpR family regulator